jgi:undecaprenyl-diphosphatase
VILIDMGTATKFSAIASEAVFLGVAILPGLSRSGSTIVGGMLSGLNRATATTFSFMMSAPIILGSLIFEIRDLFDMEGGVAAALPGGWLAPLIGVLAAAASGYFAIRWMLRLVQRVSLRWFALYTGVLGVLVLADRFVFHVLL